MEVGHVRRAPRDTARLGALMRAVWFFNGKRWVVTISEDEVREHVHEGLSMNQSGIFAHRWGYGQSIICTYEHN